MMTALRLTREVRERYGVTATELPGQMSEIRRLVAALDGEHKPVGPLRTVHAGQLEAASLINEAISLVIERFRDEVGPDVFDEALDQIEASLGPRNVRAVERIYAEAFGTGNVRTPSQRVKSLEELLLVWLANVNPAFGPMRELFADAALRSVDGYERIITTLTGYFDSKPPFGPDHQPLIAMLRSPAVAFPDSLQGQLAFIRERWGPLLGDFLDRLLIGIDILSEEERAWWLRFQHALSADGRTAAEGRHGGGSTAVYDFRAYEGEPEAFTPDRDWHPRLVLIAKSVYVWLDQLSRKYGYEIRRLDQVPDEELDRMASWGMTGLWLIGIWQRSRASEQIKRLRGKTDAAASAYSLDDYRVADDLGGDEAWLALSERAGQRGLKLAADMVPNHMGVDSEWVIQHPERFLSLSEPPYPGYSFNGPELSPDSNVSIVIEDHYWNDSDAAVVFRRQDRGSGDTRYIYHGNDGTVMPWNDTAQLNYIDANVREQVIQTILNVARRFPVIRFDAAMVLTRQHIRRLWWPQPGSGGGAIPSRAEHAISQPAFDQAMPAEFWREVVDRVAAEGLDTLLLAEAFWLLEGYFVRTLGMHRVYNSAFMHMLRDERNEEYHLVMRNTMEFDPEVLKRYVNFMSNPDEDTAVEQFGKDDKYIGICTLLATMPGLPMFAHGQVEGFGEKYGMEYRRAYFDEGVDEWLVMRHERDIFPLLRKRSQFAEVRDFLLYGFVTGDGSVNADVFAFSNGRGSERSLVIYHNRYASTAGTVRESESFLATSGSGERHLTRRTIAEGLGLPHDDEGCYVTFRDQVTQLEYVRSVREIRDRGFWIALEPYGRHVFWDFADVRDGPSGLWRQLNDRLAGRGVPSLAEAFDELVFEPVQTPFARLVSASVVRDVLEAASSPDAPDLQENLVTAIMWEVKQFVSAAAEFGRGDVQIVEEDALSEAASALRAILTILAPETPADDEPAPRSADDLAKVGSLMAVVGARALAGSEPGAAAGALHYLDEWRLFPIVSRMFSELAIGHEDARVDAVRAILAQEVGYSRAKRSIAQEARGILASWIEDEITRRAMGVNVWDGVSWVNGDLYADFVWLWGATSMMQAYGDRDGPPSREVVERIPKVRALLLQSAERAGYRVDAIINPIRRPGKTVPGDEPQSRRRKPGVAEIPPHSRSETGEPTRE